MSGDIGVTPAPEHREPETIRLDPYVREVGTVTDLNGCLVHVGIDYDAVTVNGQPLSRDTVDEFARLFAAACWDAGEAKRRMDTEASDGR